MCKPTYQFIQEVQLQENFLTMTIFLICMNMHFATIIGLITGKRESGPGICKIN